MAAKSPNLSNAADRLASQQGANALNASKKPVTGKADALNAVVSDQDWLEQSQQVWAEQRAKELELARAEKSGDRVLQLLEGEQLGEATGQSLVLAQANTSEDDRKAAAAKAENDRKAVGLKDDDDGGYIWPILGLGLLAAAAGRGGSSSDPVTPPEPVEPGNALLVYSTEDEGGDRAESGDTDTNTDNGPYRLVRVAAYETNDSAELDDGSGDSLYVDFADREDLLFEVSAEGDGSLACADISTDESFSGEMSVIALGDDTYASFDFIGSTSGEATHSIELTLDADGESSDVFALVDLSGDEGITASVDTVVSADGEESFASLDLYVYSDSGDALLSGDTSVTAAGVCSDADGYVDVWSNSGDATIIGNFSATTSAESADVTLDIYVEVENENSDEDVAMLSGDIQVTVAEGAEDASIDVYVEVSIDDSGEASYSGDLTVSTESGSYLSYATAEINLFGEDGYAHYSGDVLVRTDGVSTDADARISLEASDSEMEGNVAVVASARDSSSSVCVDISADDTAWIWGSSTETDDSNDNDGVIGSTENDVAAEWSAVAEAQDSSADLYASVEVDNYISAELNVTAQAAWSSAEAAVDIDLFATNDIDLQGAESLTYTLASDGDDASFTVGEDNAQTVEAAQFTSTAGANASSDVSLDMDAFGNVNASVNFLVDAEGRDADAETDVYISSDNYVFMGGGWSCSDTFNATYFETLDASDEITASGEDLALGEDAQGDAAEWVVTASGVCADADLNVDIEGDTDYSADLHVNLTVQATNDGGAYANIDLINSELDSVDIGGDVAASASWDLSYISDDAQDNLVGEDFQLTFASSEAAAEWDAIAADGGEASVDVSVDAYGEVDINVNMMADAGADACADIDLNVDTELSVHIGGAASFSTDGELSFSESDQYQQYASGEDTYETLEAASWEALATGENGTADVYVDIDNVSSTDADYDVIMSVDLLTEASATDSSAEIYIEVDADSYLSFNGGSSYTYTSLEAQPSDDVSVDFSTEASTEYAATWEATASGVDSYSSIEVGASADDIDFRVNQTITASGTNSFASTEVYLDASDDISVSGEVTYSYSCNDMYDSVDTSTDTQNAVWTVSATGTGSYASMDFEADADDYICLDVDVAATATGADSVVSVDISAEAYSYDVSMGYEDGSEVTVTATGSNSLAYTEIYLTGEDVSFDGKITVTANAASGLDADAVMDFELNAEGYSSVCSDISVSALGADNDATLVLDISSDVGSADIAGDLYVKAVEGIATVSVSVDGSFDSFVSLDADEGGEVFMTIVADVVSTGDIYVYTDNDGEVTLNMDVNSYDEFEDIDVYGDAGGVFNLVIQDGFDVSVDLSDDVQGYGGQFNLVIESPIVFVSASGDEFGYSIEINGFDTTNPVLDTIDIKGADFNGYYIDATDSNDYTDEFSTFADFLTSADTALDGDVDYFFGTNGTDGWLAIDGDGADIDYVITLLGVTNLDWDSVLSTQGQYTMLP